MPRNKQVKITLTQEEFDAISATLKTHNLTFLQFIRKIFKLPTPKPFPNQPPTQDN